MSKAAHPPIPATFLSRACLLAQGLDRGGLQACVSDGRLHRVRKGRYLPAGTHDDILRAAGLGGRIDCVSLLHLLGVFVLDHRTLHIQVENGASRLPPCPRDAVRHWRSSRAEPAAVTADIVEALAQACRCQSLRDAVATLDSAWYQGIIDEAEVAEVFRRLPRRFRALRALLDPRAESGPETIVRLMLRALAGSVEVQVEIHGVGRVDIVVDGWLIIECDSKAHHEGWTAQKRDRRRDLAAARLGYVTLRPIAEDILYRREEVLATFKAVLAAGVSRGPVHQLLKKSGQLSQSAPSAAQPPDLEEFVLPHRRRQRATARSRR